MYRVNFTIVKLVPQWEYMVEMLGSVVQLKFSSFNGKILLPARRGGDEDVGDQRKGGQTVTPTLGTDIPTGLFRSEVNVDGRGIGFNFTGKAKGARD